MENFGKVGLGFAEFVSHLLHETFDATLSAQNYQLEKYLELEKALAVAPAQFRELYISDDRVHEEEIAIFGVSLAKNMVVSQALLDIIATLVEDYSGLISYRKLTEMGHSTLRQIVIEKLVAEKKDSLRLLLNKTEMAQLMVESGEIKVKLELSILSKTQQEGSGSAGAKTAVVPIEAAVAEPVAGNLPNRDIEKFSSKIYDVNGVKVREMVDAETSKKVLVFAKSDVQKEADTISRLPDTRIIANPMQTTSSSNLFSEVVIRFKTK